MSKIQIVENTLRDGSYMVDFQFSTENTSEIAGGLSNLGFDFIEVGHGLGLGAWNQKEYGLAKESDVDYVLAAKKESNNAQIGVFFIPGIGQLSDIDKAIDSGIDFIRIGTNVDTFRLAHKFAIYAKKKGLFVAVNLMKSYGVKSYEFTKIVEEIATWEAADVVYLVDSAGCMLPNEVFDYISETRQKVQVELGFHGHNNLSLAVANSIEAINAGATFIDTCVRGMGRSAGNAQTEITVHVLKRLGLLSLDIDLYALYDFANATIVPAMRKLQGLSDEDIHIGVSRFHTSFMPYAKEAAMKNDIDIRMLIKAVSDINCINPSVDLFQKVAADLKTHG